jgi:two-component system, NtrC family, nitrogen regulation sensor histidine kinase NtrY
MRRALLGKGYLLMALALVCGATAVILLVFGGLSSPEALRARVERNVQADFAKMIKETETESEQIAARYNSDRRLGNSDNVVRLALDKDCQLVEWNNSELMPSPRIMDDLCQFPNHRTLQDKNKIYYYLRHEAAPFEIVTLVPLSIDYKVNNAFLPRKIFLGRYTEQSEVAASHEQFEVHLRQVEGGVRVFDGAGNFVYCITVPDITVFSFGQRVKILWLMLGFAVFGFAGMYRLFALRTFQIGSVKVAGMWPYLVALLLGRVLLFQFGLPNSFIGSQLFSPTILAIGKYAPSLGDLLINVVVVLISIYLLIRTYRRRLSVLYRHALKNQAVAWTLQCIVLTVCGLFTWWFFAFVKDVIGQSTINFEFQNVFKLDKYSYLAFGMIGAVLVGWQLIVLELLRFSFHFLKGKGNRRERLMKAALSLGWLAALSFFLFGWQPAYLISLPLVVALSLVIFVRTARSTNFRLDLPNFLLVIFMFSLLSMVGILTGNDSRGDLDMQLVADQQSNDHDLITEFVFQRVVGEVEAEAFLLDYTDEAGLSKRLKERFFESSFKGYEVRIFVYDQRNELVDKTGDYRPYLFPNSDPSLEQMGTSTRTDGLYLVKYYKGLFENIYIGKFNLLLRSLGSMLVWVELLPTEFSPNRLYPQLLLDDKVRKKSLISNEYEYAVYKDGRLFRKRADNPFPIFYRGPKQKGDGKVTYTTADHFHNLYAEVGNGKVVHVRRPVLGAFDAVNVFSYIFYFFILASILLMLPFWLMRFLRNPSQARQLSLRSRIQAFFLCLSVLPLFIVVFFLSPYIKEHIFNDIRSELQTQTQQIASHIREDYLKLRRYSTSYSAVHGNLRKNLRESLDERLASIEKTFGNDINVYYSNGKLHLTTQPSIFELGLTSKYMNPDVYRAIRNGSISDIVIEDKIGNVTYFSGFYPIMSDERKIVGFLNIPYYKNQESVNEQSLRLLTLLVNIYVFIFLAIGIVAVIISNSIIRPLGLLSQKLQGTNLGRRNEPIQWDSSDEIGEIIQAYNEMLKKLESSEEKLARSEREMAWQEMARQVAHEIKNPLTPMRLSVQHLVRTWSGDKPANEKLNNLFEKVTRTILVQIESLVNIANSFSQFANMPEPQRTTFVLQNVVQEVYDLYANDEEVQFELDMPQDEFSVHSDRDQLSRVLNNLIKNGKQAIEQEKGKIAVSMKVEGNLAKIIIEDNGKGIPEEIGDRIFEPRFSTKSSGMGLGLAIVKKIVEGAGGRIYFESEVGKGTRFFVELPRA